MSATSRSAFLAGLCLFAAVLPASVRAQEASASEQQRLFQKIQDNPKDLATTVAYAKVASDRGDYEAAIGALEGLLVFQRGLGRVKYELGTLYFRLGSYEMARRYYKEALESGDLDAATRALISTSMPDADKQLKQSRLSGFFQAGLRYQSNANYSPTGDVIRLGGQDLSLLSTATRRSDGNAFELAGISHDYDLENQRGDLLETRFIGYGTQQFHLTGLNIGLVDASFGPRLAVSPETLPGVSVKPYIVGGTIFLGGASFLSSGGAGLTVHIPAGPKLAFDPFFEYRAVTVNNGSTIPVSSLNSGNNFTYGLAAVAELTTQIGFNARVFYQRGDAFTFFNAYDQFAGEASLSFGFTPLLGTKTKNWTMSPFAKVIQTKFDAPNPFLDPATRRRDNEKVAGLVFDAPLTKDFGFTATAQYDHTGSTLPNFRQNNVSVMAGPTARF